MDPRQRRTYEHQRRQKPRAATQAGRSSLGSEQHPRPQSVTLRSYPRRPVRSASCHLDVFLFFVHDLPGWGGWVIQRRLRVTFHDSRQPEGMCRRPSGECRVARIAVFYESDCQEQTSPFLTTQPLFLGNQPFLLLRLRRLAVLRSGLGSLLSHRSLVALRGLTDPNWTNTKRLRSRDANHGSI